MIRISLFAVLLGFFAFSHAVPCPYYNERIWNRWGFVNEFNFYEGNDQNNGFVKYVDRNTALSSGYVKVDGDGVYLGVDYNRTDKDGRRSVRLESKETFVTGLFILDLEHMPDSVCGSWPSWWFSGDNFPYNGEINVIDGVNTNSMNQASLRTRAGCSMGKERIQTGKTVGSDCAVNGTKGDGCGVLFNNKNSFGTGFNNNKGGFYVMERSTEVVHLWYFPRNAAPSSLFTDTPDPCQFGTPDADYNFKPSCSADHFGPQRVIFDVSFCGDWAGSQFKQQGCGEDCNNYVATNPAAFKDSYWRIRSLRIYSRWY